ncbi:MAG: GIY-YIG nuclease family protein [Acholeplasmatales bacterium]|jgi:hypothetical protein|nr:GIY-YIG nuclease family protein [Acholeplasmatales bacterium]
MLAKSKTIKLLLNDGSLNGLLTVVDSSWNTGIMIATPRKSIDELTNTKECNQYGVYLLISSKKVYVGQSMNLRNRIKQHDSYKEWWERAILLTTTDNSFNKSDIDYLESVLINKATKLGTIDSDNKNMGNPPKVDRFREPELEQYIEEGLLLLELIGITVFAEKKSIDRKERTDLINTENNSNRVLEIGQETNPNKKSVPNDNNINKEDSIKLLKKQGCDFSNNNINYGTIQLEKDVFWLNPNVKNLKKDWYIILNNQEKKIIYFLQIPENTFSYSYPKETGKLCTRKDRKNTINLNISQSSFDDTVSGCGFKSFIKKEINY